MKVKDAFKLISEEESSKLINDDDLKDIVAKAYGDTQVIKNKESLGKKQQTTKQVSENTKPKWNPQSWDDFDNF